MYFPFDDIKNNTILGTPISELEDMATEIRNNILLSMKKHLKITVANILYLIGGNTKVEIRNWNRDDGAFDSILWSGIVDDVEWGNEPFRKHEVEHMSVAEGENTLRIYVNMETDLYNADPNCQHLTVPMPGGGIKCIKCRGWFCY